MSSDTQQQQQQPALQEADQQQQQAGAAMQVATPVLPEAELAEGGAQPALQQQLDPSASSDAALTQGGGPSSQPSSSPSPSEAGAVGGNGKEADNKPQQQQQQQQQQQDIPLSAAGVAHPDGASAPPSPSSAAAGTPGSEAEKQPQQQQAQLESAGDAAAASSSAAVEGGKKASGGKPAQDKEIFTYEAPWPIYGMAWSVRPDKPFRLAVGSFIEEYNNKIEIIKLNEEIGEFEKKAEFVHPYPATKIQWIPDKTGSREDLLATTGDYLRLWKVGDDGNVSASSLLNKNKQSEFCAPLTSFDWNDMDPSVIGTSSIDTTCTIWDIETGQTKTQLIAHDKEVFDMAFAPSTDVFASVGADGSLRMFDLRYLEHSTIIYEAPGLVPLLRLCWNKTDHNYLATFLMERNEVVVLDIRSPSVPVAELSAHTRPVNSISWAPHSACHICTGGDDSQALIWDLTALPEPINEPILAYAAGGEINTLQWSRAQPEWVGITFEKRLQILRV